MKTVAGGDNPFIRPIPYVIPRMMRPHVRENEGE